MLLAGPEAANFGLSLKEFRYSHRNQIDMLCETLRILGWPVYAPDSVYYKQTKCGVYVCRYSITSVLLWKFLWKPLSHKKDVAIGYCYLISLQTSMTDSGAY